MKKVFLSFLASFVLIYSPSIIAQDLVLGADRLDMVNSLVKDKRVGLVVNQTSILSNGAHLLDALLSNDTKVAKIFAPEHGFRGNADAGETIVDGKDVKTGISLISIYGKNKKPSAEQLADVDVVIFDIQDVGTRFFTYISTMHYVMEACAENDKLCIVLDRPNPNDYIDGPVLEPKYRSFVGMHPIPVVHGLTVGELAQMINGEGWLTGGKKCRLEIVPMEGWVHGQSYSPPVNPSPNLPNDQSILLYPSICFFEATIVSLGRGTEFPFQVIGSPGRKFGTFSFTPRSVEGAKNPPQKDKVCYGEDLRQHKHGKEIDLSFLLRYYKKSGMGKAFFSNPKHMDLLAGTNKLRLQILRGETKENIVKSWQKDLSEYKTIHKKYLLYPDK